MRMAEQVFDDALDLAGDYSFTEKSYYTKVTVKSSVDNPLGAEHFPQRSTENMKRVYTLFDIHKQWVFTGSAEKMVDDYIAEGIGALPESIRPIRQSRNRKAQPEGTTGLRVGCRG